MPGLLARTVAALAMVATSLAVSDESSYLEELRARALAQNLAQAREWHTLLHYEPNRIGDGLTSAAVSPWFFLSPTGRHDPGAELEATLAAFFRPELIAPRDEPAQCVFIARYQWLKSRLGFDPRRLPESDCERFKTWHDALDVGAVTMVFPAAYLNSPASMFGHTLLRLDARAQTQRRELLAYAVNFAAETAEDNGLVFAVRGLTGGYQGSFGIYPYYEKVKEYARIENRDLWEYPLQFTDAEIERLLRHLWELRGVTFDYYFLKYNCSYQLLALLESARPGLELMQRFRNWAIPTDTLRVLAETPGLVGEPAYRPALSTQLEAQTRVLSPAQAELAIAVAEARLLPGDPAVTAQDAGVQARILQVAHDYLYYQHLAGRRSRENALPRAREILVARSRIAVSADFPAPRRPGTPPDRGHRTRRLALGFATEDGRQSLRMHLRPAYHDLLDAGGGYASGAQINFLDLGIAVDIENQEAKLEYLRAIDIVSLAPRDRFFQPVSWRVNTGLRRPLAPLFARDAPGLGLYVEGGPGLAWEWEGVLAHVFAMGSLDLNDDLAHRHSAGLGVAAGFAWTASPRWDLQLELGNIERVWGQEDRESWLRLGQQWQLASDFGLRLEFERREIDAASWSRAALSGQWYF